MYVLFGLPGGTVVKNPPANIEEQEAQIRSLGQEDPLEKEMETHSSTLAWKIPWTEEPGRLQSLGLQRVGHDWLSNFPFLFPVTKKERHMSWSYL